MIYIITLWNYFWWLYHTKHANKHDVRMERIIPEWRKRIIESEPKDEDE